MHRRALLLALSSAAAAPAWAVDTTKAQPELPKEPLIIVTSDKVEHRFDVEMALTEDQQTVGEMFRPSVPADGGMLFDWGVPRDSQMWMRNTVASLDMIFIDADGKVHAIAENAVPGSLATIDSHGPVRATLEVAAGTAVRLNIRVGDIVKQRIFGNAK